MKKCCTSLVILTACLLATPLWAETVTLQECLEHARRNNPGLKVAAWDTRIAEEGIRQASAARYPRVDTQAGYTLQQAAQGVKINGMETETQRADYASGTMSATYTIYDFGKRDARIEQASALADSAAFTFEGRRSDVAMQVIEAYFGILEAGRLVVTAEEEVAQVEQHRRMAQALLEEGAVTRNDVLQADVRLAAARQNLLTARNRRENAWLRLNFLTGAERSFRGELDEKAGIIVADTRSDNGRALSQRAEIQGLRKAVEASDAEVRENSRNYYPELYTRLALDYVQNNKVIEQTIMSATVGLKLNLFDGFATTSARERAVRSRSRSLDLLRQTEQQVRLEIDMARNDMQVAGERIVVAEAAIRQSDENLRINHERYRERVGTATEVLDAQTLLTRTKSDYYRALFDMQVASARLKRAMGEL